MNNNNNYIYTNSNLIYNTIINIINISKKSQKNNTCPLCEKKFNNIYLYKHKNTSIKIFEYQIHLLKYHNIIESTFYKKICTSDIVSNNIVSNNIINWSLMNTNSLNIIDGLYEIGSNQIYIEKNKNISESKISRFSEHSGFIYFEKNKIKNINIITGSRVEQSDPLIFMPTNCLEALKVDYIFHTHPKTPYIGSRIKFGIIYEFPSISDIIHFIEHHNNGKLLGSIVIAPEGIYIIRKNNFDRNFIQVDYDIMVSDLEDIFIECYSDSYSRYSEINYNDLKINGEIKLPDNFFYEQISINYEYIDKINIVLEKYDLFIDYYARILFNKPNSDTQKWIFDDIYVPIIN